LIRKFVDPDAEFLFAPPGCDGARLPKGQRPITFQILSWGRGGKTAFNTIIAKYTIDPRGLSMMADIVWGADRKVAEPAEGAGVAAISHGFAMLDLPDEEVLRLQLPMGEALHAFCCSKDKLESIPAQFCSNDHGSNGKRLNGYGRYVYPTCANGSQLRNQTLPMHEHSYTNKLNFSQE